MKYLWLLLASGLLLFQIGFWLVRLRHLYLAQRNTPVLSPDADTLFVGEPPLVTVIVPAHDEEATIGECLKSVVAQDYPNLRILLVNDRSSDATARLAKEVARDDARFSLMEVETLRPGWTGKCNALDLGIRQTEGEWFVFLDADSVLHPAAVRQCLHRAISERLNLVTLSPLPRLESFWEKALQPMFMAMSCILFPLHKVNDRKHPMASACGMFMLMSRSAYDAIGGHAAVRGLAVEDIGLGKRIKAAGLGLLFANGKRLMTTRMYTNRADILKGWTRILSASMNYDLGVTLQYLFMNIIMSPLAMVAATLIFMGPGWEMFPNSWFILPAVAFVISGIVADKYCRTIGAPPMYAPLMAFGNSFLIWVYLVIPKKILRKEALEWRGTTYSENVYAPTALDPAAIPAEASPWESMKAGDSLSR